MGYIMNTGWFLALVALIVIGIIVHGLYEPLTANRYVLNTYMYILLAIIIVATTWTITDDLSDNYVFELNGYHYIGLLILTFLSFSLVIMSTNKLFTYTC